MDLIVNIVDFMTIFYLMSLYYEQIKLSGMKNNIEPFRLGCKDSSKT